MGQGLTFCSNDMSHVEHVIHMLWHAGKLYTLDTHFGTKEELVSLISALKDAGILPIADIVINHRCAQEQDDSGVWNSFS